MKNTNAIITLLFLLLILAVPANGQTGSNALSSVNISGIDKERMNRYDDFLKKEISEGRIPGAVSYIMRRGEIVHETAYGYNPVEIWLNETAIWTNPTTGEEIEYPANPWYSLGFEYGYSDHYTTYTDVNTGEVLNDWIWKDEDGNIVAYSDLDFRNGVFGDLMNRYNNEQWDLLDPFMVLSPVIGADFYHYKNNFWVQVKIFI